VPSRNSNIPRERKYGRFRRQGRAPAGKARRRPRRLGHHGHVGSQDGDAEAYTSRGGRGRKLMQGRRGELDRLEVGGAPVDLRGRTAHRRRSPPSCAPSSKGVDQLPIGDDCRLPVRAGTARWLAGGRVTHRARGRAARQRVSSTMAATARCSMRRTWASTSCPAMIGRAAEDGEPMTESLVLG